MDRLPDIIIEMLRVSSIEWSLDNRIYKSNPQNINFNDLAFNGDESFIARWRYRINNDIRFRLINGSRFYV